MRITAYHLFEIVAWPALIWCSVEVAIRIAASEPDGLGMTLLTGGCAALTVVGARIRTKQISAYAPIETRD